MLGLKEVPTVRLAHLSEAEKRAYVLADNRLAELAGWDREILAIELQGLIDLEFDVELTGFEMGEIDIILDEAEQGPHEEAEADDNIPERGPGQTVKSGRFDRWVPGELLTPSGAHAMTLSWTRSRVPARSSLPPSKPDGVRVVSKSTPVMSMLRSNAGNASRESPRSLPAPIKRLRKSNGNARIPGRPRPRPTR